MAVRYNVEYECGMRLGAALARIEAEKNLARLSEAATPSEKSEAQAAFEAAAKIERKILEKITSTPTPYRTSAA